jgi:hypothetical protein
MKAWVVTLEGMKQKTQVVGILSARKQAAFARQYTELLYAHLRCSPRANMNMAKYQHPEIPYEARAYSPHESIFWCGDEPYLVLRLATQVVLDESHRVPVLTWRNPDQIKFDLKALRVVSREPRSLQSAPFRSAPLRRDDPKPPPLGKGKAPRIDLAAVLEGIEVATRRQRGK